MIDILLSASLFVLSIAVHAFFCRHKPKGVLYAKDFILIAVCFLMVDVYLMLHLSSQSPRLIVSSVAIYLLMIPVYLIVYVSMILMSPSKRILNALNAKSSLTYQELLKRFNGEELIDLRLKELLESRCLIIENNRYMLTFQGEIIYQTLQAYQHLSGRKGEG